jgi:hypothetical protein
MQLQKMLRTDSLAQNLKSVWAQAKATFLRFPRTFLDGNKGPKINRL